MVHSFEVPDTLRTSMTKSIRELKNKKSPVPDRIRTEILQTQPALFADTGMALLNAVGLIGNLPAVIHSVILSSI